MKNDGDDRVVSEAAGELDRCILASHLLGKENALVLPGFGSASVKIPTRNLFGEVEDILWISAAGQNLGMIEAAGFTPLHNASLSALGKLENLSEAQYKNALYCSRTRADALLPPLEAILHAILPGRYAFLTCPEALLAITNTANWQDRLRQHYQDRLLIFEGPQPDFPLPIFPQRFSDIPKSDLTEGILFPGVGLLTFGDEVGEAYSRTIRLVSQAEAYLQASRARDLDAVTGTLPERPLRQDLPSLRKTVSELAGFPVVMGLSHDPLSIGFSRREDLPVILQGAVTPAQVTTIKSPPLLKQDLESHRQKGRASHDPDREGSELGNVAPQIILDPEWGILTAGCTAEEVKQVEAVYLQAIRVLLRAQALGHYQPLFPRGSPRRWLAENTAGKSSMFSGEVALVTGGASGIGKACVESLLARGAAVACMDINPYVKTLYDRADYLGLETDLTDEAAVLRGFETIARTYGGLDMLVLNAGVFPAGIRIESLDQATWQKVLRINLDSYLTVMREAYPMLRLSMRGGRVVLNASKNVLAPGAGAAAYSASKAAVTQLARVAALEWGKEHIRINIIHPDAVYDTGIWTEEVLNARAAYYGMTVQQYKTRNVLGVELDSHYVGELVAEMLGPLFEKITGAQIPVDGGSDRVI